MGDVHTAPAGFTPVHGAHAVSAEGEQEDVLPNIPHPHVGWLALLVQFLHDPGVPQTQTPTPTQSTTETQAL